jgi:protein SCO1
MGSRHLTIAAVVLIVVAAALGTAFVMTRGSSHVVVTGETVNRPVPRLALEGAAGQRTSLAAFKGKVVVMSPFLTLCSEVCPLTTGAFEAMRRDVDRAGLGDRVTFAEVSVDPWRDTPARLRAFARLAHVEFPLLTGTVSQLAAFWRFFGVAYWRTPEGKPPDRDWLTGKPLTFDVSHTDALFLLSANGRERIVDVGMPNASHALPADLKQLLDSAGRRDLEHPGPGWTIRQGLDDIGSLLGRPIPAAT